MMIEMEQPFVWPEEPTNFDEYVIHFTVLLWERLEMAFGLGREMNANGVL